MSNSNIEKSFNLDRAVQHLADSIKIKTVSYPDYEKMDFKLFDEFLLFLEKTYPNINRVCKKELVSGYCPVYIWESQSNNNKPILLLGHYDVVPVEKDSEADWEEAPFSGTVKDDYIWGRGSLDDKNQVIAVMEAIEHLMSNDYTPDRDIYMVFGFDEEIGGMRGAEEAAKAFKERNIEFECVIDEGGCIITDMIEGLTVPAAIIGIAEKGSTNIKITVEGQGGHSSMPDRNTTIGTIAKIISNVENNPMPARLIMPVREMLRTMAPYMKENKFVLKNIDHLFPIINPVMAKNPLINALIRTTIAFTMTGGGDVPNVLPRKAWTVANLRILQGDSVDSTLEHIKKVNPGINFEIEKMLVEEPSEISSIDSESYKILGNIINEIYPEAVIIPYLMIGGTDSRKYLESCKNIYRFSAVILTKEDDAAIHSSNERISIINFHNMIRFYIRFLLRYQSE
ncbi:M20/M25/M40 family metallo-hydrolase [Lutispora sp.]|uniref:M20/M25/M40 family metallo-hydrolase n=1 Tax=Lutispora sp. TaxID=2828727 RepID=UPI002B2207AE|nr:M20/M25/M40 family metallo-hydrolase [Lutispora sp.]MEA4963323.1 M20/M25/M40 family metallo-hydrolase [Lutispora sp.]